MRQWFERHRGTLGIVALSNLVYAILLGAVLLVRSKPASSPIIIRPITPPPTLTTSPTATPHSIRIYVCGAVAHPGVYALAWDGRVEQAIAAAGGAASDADLVRVNLSKRLFDEEQIYVPSKSEQATPVLPTPGSHAENAGRPTSSEQTVNINTSTSNQLEALSGIGPALAQRIIDYRNANGPFTDTAQIKNVRGIGDHIFERIKDMITIE